MQLAGAKWPQVEQALITCASGKKNKQNLQTYQEHFLATSQNKIFFMASFLHYDIIVGDNLFNMTSLIFNHPFKARYIIIGFFWGGGMHDNAQSPLNPVVLEKQLKCKKFTDTRLTYHYSAVFLVSKNTLWAFMTQCLLTYISNKDVTYYSHVDLLLKLLT